MEHHLSLLPSLLSFLPSFLPSFPPSPSLLIQLLLEHQNHPKTRRNPSLEQQTDISLLFTSLHGRLFRPYRPKPLYDIRTEQTREFATRVW
ncbi:hypothetical protein M501DRAFT_996722 [Patellaria atrata CBS 101060]|uniref:Uncharacterized protein n=1 Tax=Patellaria atrata CBS 101060 TaxID=1346257 RepID=A0A9P4S600_9PEZI|nr:hypothetical protein M501DRAFT_996722 [Patellaria atrata CBS 101060]